MASYTLLSPRLLETLPTYWRICRPRTWLFPIKAGDGPLFDQTAQRVYRATCDAAEFASADPHHFAKQISCVAGQFVKFQAAPA